MIYIITPVFNRKKFTQNYLQALFNQTIKNFKVVIVDDGSTDGTVEMIQENFPSVILLKTKGNLWWAEATNIGVKYAIESGTQYIMTLNDDTIPENDYIEKMLYWSNKKPYALLGAFAINAKNNQSIYGGEILNWKTGNFENILNTIPLEKQNGLHKVNTFPGRGLLIPIDVFNNIGFYDSKNFPQTVADLDFTARADTFGYEIYCNYDAKIKIYPEESGGVSLLKNRSLKNYYQHLFGMKGSGNLKWFTIFAFKNAPKKYFIKYWLKGLAKRIIGYPYKWIKEIINAKK